MIRIQCKASADWVQVPNAALLLYGSVVKKNKSHCINNMTVG